MLNLTETCKVHTHYTPFIFFSFCVVAGIDEMRRSWKFQLLFVCLFVSIVLYSDLNFMCFSTKNAPWYAATWKITLRGAKFCDKPPYNVKNIVSKVTFCCRIQIWHQNAWNLLLLDIIGLKNATLFIRDQLQGVITSHPTVPPPQEINFIVHFSEWYPT